MIVFRTNAGPNIGYGHIFRCIALAKAIKEKNSVLEIKFVVNEAAVDIVRKYKFEYLVSNKYDDILLIKGLKPEAIIFDSYLANNSYLVELKKIARLIIFDDNNDLYDSSIPELIINGNIHAEKLNYNTKALLGPKYLVMRSEYWDVKITKNSKRKLCITTGGSDFNNLMPKFVKSLKELQYNKSIIIGPGYSKKEISKIELIHTENDKLIYKPRTLINIFNDSAIILTASGTSIYEILRLNRIPIIYTLADNQKKIANELDEYGVLNIGNYTEINYNGLKNTIEEYIKSITKKEERLKGLFEIFDGQGSRRVAKYIIEKVI